MPSIRSLYSIVKAGVKSVKFFVKAMWFTFNHSGIIWKMRAVISGEIFYSCQFWCCYGSFIMECFIMEVTTNTKDDRWIEPMLVARFFEDTLIILNKLLLLASVFLLGKCLLPMFFFKLLCSRFANVGQSPLCEFNSSQLVSHLLLFLSSSLSNTILKSQF